MDDNEVKDYKVEGNKVTEQMVDDKIREHLHDGNFSQRVNFFDLFGNVQTSTAVPVDAPRNIYEQVVIYYNSGSAQWTLYIFDYTTNTWLKFSTITSSGGPAGADTQIAFSDAGAWGADADFTWNKTTNTLTVNGTVIANTAVTTPLINTASGSLTITPASGGNILLNAVVLATTAITGFPVIPTMAGTPTGAASSGAIVYDTTAEKLWVRSGATWRFTQFT